MNRTMNYLLLLILNIGFKKIKRTDTKKIDSSLEGIEFDLYNNINGHKIAIEYDGGHWGHNQKKDMKKNILCKKNNIKHAYVTCFGSFKKCGYMYLVPKEDAKVGAGYGNVLQKDGPVEFLNGTGVVCQNNNAYDTHFHATMCDASGNVFGGHIVKGYTPTLTTVDLIIFEIKDIEMLRVYDEETDLTQFLPE